MELKSSVYLYAFPLFLPVPRLNRHVVTPCEDDTRGRVNCQTSDVVRVGLKSDDLLVGVVIERAQLKVIGTCNKPVLARDEADTSHGNLCNFKSLHKCTGFVIIYVDRAIV